MATHILPADTLLSTLLPSGGGSLASGDTIDFNGHALVMDCDAVDYPFTPANAGGVPCRLELRDLSRIKLNATLPATVHPWIDPAHPLPAAAEPGIDGNPYRTPLTANARAEIQLNGGFGLGGGAADLPTETRSGNFWAKVVSSPGATELVFDRDLPLHPGDIVAFSGAPAYSGWATAAGYDSETQKALFAGNLDGGARAAGAICGICSGGVCVRSLYVGHISGFITAPARAGTLVVVNCARQRLNGAVLNGSAIAADRLAVNISADANTSGLIAAGTVIARQVLCGALLRGGGAFVRIGTCVCTRLVSDGAICSGHVEIGDMRQQEAGSGSIGLQGTLSVEIHGPDRLGGTVPVAREKCALRTGDTTQIGAGTVTRTARTDFPAATDLPDAFFHAPATAGDVTWRCEDRWVRKGETLRMRVRWMPAATGARASVAVTDLAVWWPDLWPIGAEALAKAEFAAGLEQLKWHDGAVEWRNDTGEDCQVRVWECVSGDTLGGYLRVWESTGGPM